MEVIADYNKDFYAWLMKNANLLRQHKFNEVDIEHVAEELESMGKSEKRIDILELLEDSPSLHHELGERITIAKARLNAEDETGIDKNEFPEICPFTFEQLLKKDFLPE